MNSYIIYIIFFYSIILPIEGLCQLSPPIPLSIEVADSAMISIKSNQGLRSDQGAWVSGLDIGFTSDFVPRRWQWIADGTDRSLILNKVSPYNSSPVLYIGDKNKYGFGHSSPIVEYDFANSSLAPTLLLRQKYIEKGLLLQSGGHAQIMNQQYGYLDFLLQGERAVRISSIGFEAQHLLSTKNRLRISKGSNLWDIFIGANSCEADSKDLAFSFGFSLKAVIDSETGDYCNTSDLRLKKNIMPLDNIPEKIKQLKAYSFHYISQSNEEVKHIGYMAQDVIKIFPELVTYLKDSDKYNLGYRSFAVLAISALQQRQQRLENIKEKIKKLESTITKLESE